MRKWRQRTWRLLAIGAGLLFAAVIVVLGLQLRNEQRLQFTAYRTGTWVLVAAEIELIRFQNALHASIATPESSDPDQLMLRFDIFWSRVPIILESDEAAGIREIEGLVETFQGIARRLPDWERRLLAASGDDHETLALIAAELDPYRSRIHDAVVLTLVNDESVFQRESLANRLGQMGLLFGLLCAVGTVIVVLLLRQLRHSERLADQATSSENAAMEARTLLSDIIESIDSAITYSSADGRITFVNKAFSQQFPELRDLVLSQIPLDAIRSKKDRMGVKVLSGGQETTYGAMQRRGRESMSFEELWPDGRNYLVREIATADGGVAVVRTDISEIRQQQNELADRMAAIEASSDGLLITDSSDNVRHVSQSFLRMFELPSVDMALGVNWRDVVCRTPDPEMLESCKTALREHGEWRGEVMASGRSGRDIPIEIYCKRMESRAMVIAVRDLREQKRQQAEQTAISEELFRAQKLDALGRLAGGVAHDFNNVLGAIMGYADMLAEDLPRKSEQRDFAQRILSAGEHGRDLVQQVLSFTRTETSEKKSIGIGTVIDDTMDMIRSSIPARIQLDARIGDRTAQFHGNTTQISQVLVNLCLNARDAMQNSDGRILVSTGVGRGLGRLGWDQAPPGTLSDAMRLREGPEEGRIRIWVGRLDPDQKYLKFEIVDEGDGIDREVAERMLDPFFTTKARGKGTGLGLATVRRIVIEHGGGMAIDTRRGRGTSITVYLPETEADEEAEVIAADFKGPTVGSGSLLIVDDEEAVGTQLGLRFERLGYEVLVLEDPRDAVTAIREAPGGFDALITDLSMPQINGIELARRVRSISPDLLVYLCSGNIVDIRGRNDVIAPKRIFEKPVDFRQLADMLAKELEQTRLSA